MRHDSTSEEVNSAEWSTENIPDFLGHVNRLPGSWQKFTNDAAKIDVGDLDTLVEKELVEKSRLACRTNYDNLTSHRYNRLQRIGHVATGDAHYGVSVVY